MVLWFFGFKSHNCHILSPNHYKFRLENYPSFSKTIPYNYPLKCEPCLPNIFTLPSSASLTLCATGHGHARSILIMPSAKQSLLHGASHFRHSAQKHKRHSIYATSVLPISYINSQYLLTIRCLDLIASLAYPLLDKSN